MNESSPKVSIVLPTYNGSRMIARTLSSVRTQTYDSWELLVMDDGSTDGTAAIVQEIAAQDSRIRYIRNETNLGIQKTLNWGLKESRGVFIARIDDDDAWVDTGKLSTQVAYMEAHPDCVLVGTGTIVVDEKGSELYRYLSLKSDAAIRAWMLFRNCFTHSSVLFSREAALRLGGYGEGPDTRHVEDYDLWLRLGTVGTLANLPLHAVAFTVSAKSISSVHKLTQLKKDRVLARKYGSSYPGRGRALAHWTILIGLYGAFTLLPKSMQQRLIGWNKKRS